jgi:hypothetical protein
MKGHHNGECPKAVGRAIFDQERTWRVKITCFVDELIRSRKKIRSEKLTQKRPTRYSRRLGISLFPENEKVPTLTRGWPSTVLKGLAYLAITEMDMQPN